MICNKLYYKVFDDHCVKTFDPVIKNALCEEKGTKILAIW